MNWLASQPAENVGPTRISIGSAEIGTPTAYPMQMMKYSMTAIEQCQTYYSAILMTNGIQITCIFCPFTNIPRLFLYSAIRTDPYTECPLLYGLPRGVIR